MGVFMFLPVAQLYLRARAVNGRWPAPLDFFAFVPGLVFKNSENGGLYHSWHGWLLPEAESWSNTRAATAIVAQRA